MIRSVSHLVCGFACCVYLMVLAGCASSRPSQFYALTSLDSAQAPKGALSENHGAILAVGPLVIPEYLDRPQIVTRSSENELKVDEFHRWGGSLHNDMMRVMVENLAALFPPDRFTVMGWVPPLEAKLTYDYRVAIEVVRFDGYSQGMVSLKARWELFGKERSLLLITESNITEQINGSGYDALVGAMSRALEKLAGEIAEGLRSVSRGKG